MTIQLPTKTYSHITIVMLLILIALIVLIILFIFHFVHKSTEFNEKFNVKIVIFLIIIISILSILLMIVLSIIQIIKQYVLDWNILFPSLIIFVVCQCLVIMTLTYITLSTNTEEYSRDLYYSLIVLLLSWVMFFNLFFTISCLFEDWSDGIFAILLCIPLFIANIAAGYHSNQRIAILICKAINIGFMVIAAYLGASLFTNGSNFWFLAAL